MHKEYITSALKRLKTAQAIAKQLLELGINTTDYDSEIGLISTIEESIAILLCNSDDSRFELILDDVHWWLYDGSEKTIHYDDKSPVDVTAVEDYVNWLFEQYTEKQS